MTLEARIQPVSPPLGGYHSRIMAYLCVVAVFTGLLYEQGLSPLIGGVIAGAIRR